MNTTSAPADRSALLNLAWPIILANMAGPLLGIVDTAVIGNLGDPALIGAIAVGGMIFSFLYWGFGFLRMGTTGLVSQALGSADPPEAAAAMQRAVLAGSVIGIVLLVFQAPIIDLAMTLISGSAEVERAATAYFTIRIWGAPLHLAQLAVLGYFLGAQQTRRVFQLQLVLNVTNIALDIVFVVVLGYGVEGVALATVIAELLTITVALVLLAHHGVFRVDRQRLFDARALAHMFAVNRDIMIRTLCLIFAFAWFTNQGAGAGDIILATNAILMQFVSFSAFFLDGYALAAETVVGHAVGGRDGARVRRAIRSAGELGIATALILGLLFAVALEPVVGLLTNVEAVRETSSGYRWWVVAAPLISVWCYILDGVFIGATRTAEMRNAMLVSLAGFLAAWYLTTPLGNHGLWLSLMMYFLLRAATLAWYLPRLTRATHGQPLTTATTLDPQD